MGWKWNLIVQHVRTITLTLPIFLFTAALNGQKLNFVKYSVEHGLVQSQVLCLEQDEYGFLWSGTLGGLSRFNGREFENYSKRHGLSSQMIFELAYQSGHGLWIGHQNGLQLFDGRFIRTIPFAEGSPVTPVVEIVPMGPDLVYALTAQGVLLIWEGDSVRPVDEFRGKKFYQIIRDRKNRLFGLSGNEIYSLNENNGLFMAGEQLGEEVVIQHLYFNARNDLYLITNKGLYRKTEEGAVLLLASESSGLEMKSVAEDRQGRIWLGTTSGAYRIGHGGGTDLIGAASGLTDDRIHDIMPDREGNIWIAADGLFKLSSNSLEYLDETHGLNGKVVMGMASDNKGTIWLGSIDGGLTRYSDGKAEKLVLPSRQPESQKIIALHYDRRGTLWIGTIGSGLWAMENNRYNPILQADGTSPGLVSSLYEDINGTLWVGTADGIFYHAGGILYKVPGIKATCFDILEDGAGGMLLATTSGLLKLSLKDKEVTAVDIPGFKLGTVNSLAMAGDNILIGTEDDGVLLWNRGKNSVLQCSTGNGLSSDFIFSLFSTGPDTFFAGTGRGINKVGIDQDNQTFRVSNLATANILYGPECNLNAIMRVADNELWFGTIEGVFIYKYIQDQFAEQPPLIYLNAVEINPDNRKNPDYQDSVAAWSIIPQKLKLPFNKNQIAFELNGLSLSNPNSLRYRYQLVGADDSLSEPSPTSKIIYPGLNPGTYRFKAIALSPENVASSNTIDYTFTIESPFYQKAWFKILMVGLLIFLGFLFEFIRVKLKQKQLVTNEKIRLEEQKRILERTSEDLHDDLGNKITRITVLTDVLQRKVSPDDLEKTKLINQIRDNAEALYLSTKDILWSLSPGKDNLYDTLEKSRITGTQLFEETGIDFEACGIEHSFKPVQVPLAISRNLTMILKEAFTNILRHSGASKAVMDIKYSTDNILNIEIRDNGTGNDAVGGDGGNGLTNMHKRMERIGGFLHTFNQESGGFTVKLHLKIPLNEG